MGTALDLKTMKFPVGTVEGTWGPVLINGRRTHSISETVGYTIPDVSPTFF